MIIIFFVIRIRENDNIETAAKYGLLGITEWINMERVRGLCWEVKAARDDPMRREQGGVHVGGNVQE